MRLLALVVLLAAAPVWADDDDAEQPTSVTAALTGTTARIQARFDFEIDAPGVAMGAPTFVLPPNSVVTGGVAIVNGARHKLRLECAETARRAFGALTVKPGRGTDRTSMLLIHGAGLSLRVDTLATKRAKVMLELTFEASTCFSNDHRFVELPESWWKRLPAKLRTSAIASAGVCEEASSGDDEDPTHLIGFASAHLAKEPPGAARIGVIAGRLVLPDRDIVRVEIDIARELSVVPRDLHTAIVIDHSHSMSADELEAQRAIVAAYVRAAPTSRVQVISYARTAEALLPSWTAAAQAAPVIDRAIRALPPRNGSNLDAALTEAAAWLARVRGTKRIVLFNDERLADRFGNGEHLRGLVGTEVLIHVVRPEATTPLFTHDGGRLAALAAATQGIEMVGGADDNGNVDALSLLRPTTLEGLEISAPGWEAFSLRDRDCGQSVREGQTCSFWAHGNDAAGPITMRGRLWNKPLERVVKSDRTRGRELARVLSLARNPFDVEVQQHINKLALAINPAWSLVAQWGGAGGYEDLGGFGTIGLGGFGTFSSDRGVSGPVRGPIRQRLVLDDQLRPAILGCQPGAARVDIEVETTLNEIVDVEVLVTPTNPALQACIVDAVWDTTLRIPNAPPHAASRVAFGNKR